MARLSAAQVYKLARDAGADPEEAEWLTNVALVESGDGTTADSDARNPSSGACGLWQIHPPQACGHGARALNAKIALSKLRTQGKRAWTARPGGPEAAPSSKWATAQAQARAVRSAEGGVDRDDPWWERFTGRPTSERTDKADLLDPGIGGVIAEGAEKVDDVAGALAALGRLAATVAKAAAWLTNAGWKRILMVVLGLIGLVISAVSIFGALVPSGAKQAVRSTAGNVSAIRPAKAATA